MPFGLKYAGVTYQRMAITLLHDMMHNEVEVYVDDMIVKSKDREDHIANLRKFFERIKEYRLRLNPEKCAFGVIVGKLLGFLVSDRGIEVETHYPTFPIMDNIENGPIEVSICKARLKWKVV